jgi:hypothetical protein
MDEVEKKVSAMIGESTMNKYKAFKSLVKHKKRINHVFSEVCGDKSFRSRRPGIKKKAQPLLLLAAHLDLRKLQGDHLQRKGKDVMTELLPLLCALRRPDLFNLTNESINQLRVFQTLNFRLPLVLLDLVERRRGKL